MHKIEPLPTLEMKWGVVNDADEPLLFVELKRAPECEVYEFEEHHPGGRGSLLATFFGPNAVERACDWITTVELPRRLLSRQSEKLNLANEEKSTLTQVSALSEVSNGAQELVAG